MSNHERDKKDQNGSRPPESNRGKSDQGAQTSNEKPWDQEDERMDWLGLPRETFERYLRLREVEAIELIAHRIDKFHHELLGVLKGKLNVSIISEKQEWFTPEEAAELLNVTLKTFKAHLEPEDKQALRRGKYHRGLVVRIERRIFVAKQRKLSGLNKGGFTKNLKKGMKKI